MIKRILILTIVGLFLSACSLDDENNNYGYETLPIKSAVVPSEFQFGTVATITVTYDLPSSCHHFYRLHYEYENTARIVAINSFFEDEGCTDVVTEKELTFEVSVNQQEDYVFKFWKGKDNGGNNIFEEITVPVVQ
jgi:hypothetical protein